MKGLTIRKSLRALTYSLLFSANYSINKLRQLTAIKLLFITRIMTNNVSSSSNFKNCQLFFLLGVGAVKFDPSRFVFIPFGPFGRNFGIGNVFGR